MTIKSKDIRKDKKGNTQIDKRCEEHYFYNQPESSKREDTKKNDKLDLDEIINNEKSDIKRFEYKLARNLRKIFHLD